MEYTLKQLNTGLRRIWSMFNHDKESQLVAASDGKRNHEMAQRALARGIQSKTRRKSVKCKRIMKSWTLQNVALTEL